MNGIAYIKPLYKESQNDNYYNNTFNKQFGCLNFFMIMKENHILFIIYLVMYELKNIFESITNKNI